MKNPKIISLRNNNGILHNIHSQEPLNNLECYIN